MCNQAELSCWLQTAALCRVLGDSCCLPNQAKCACPEALP